MTEREFDSVMTIFEMNERLRMYVASSGIEVSNELIGLYHQIKRVLNRYLDSSNIITEGKEIDKGEEKNG